MTNLYLIPSPLWSVKDLKNLQANQIQQLIENSITAQTLNVIKSLSHFAVENQKTARFLLKHVATQKPIQELTLIDIKNINDCQELLKNNNVGLLSEVGCPCIADPGNHLVWFAQKNNITVKPLTGPSSILLALMASGLNGQNFKFYGYLPKEESELKHQLTLINKCKDKSSHIFIETPYRNQKMLDSLCKYLSEEKLLCVAQNVTLNNEKIKTDYIKNWKGKTFEKNSPCLFIVGDR